MSEPTFRLEGAPNFRDLGGYVAADGRKVRIGQIFRSSSLNSLTDNDVDTLSKLGLRLVCDLRSESERTKNPNIWPERFSPSTICMNVDADLRANAGFLNLLSQDPSIRGATLVMADVYRSIPSMLAPNIRGFFSSLIDEDSVPLVFHCTGGKDRTGVLSAITLLALGVPREIVYEDYLKSNFHQNLSEIQARLAEYLAPIYAPEQPPQDVLSALTGVQKTYLDEAMLTMEEKDGCIDNYLQNAGVTKPQLELLRARVLE